MYSRRVPFLAQMIITGNAQRVSLLIYDGCTHGRLLMLLCMIQIVMLHHLNWHPRFSGLGHWVY